jgi:predicted transcriptional regulator
MAIKIQSLRELRNEMKAVARGQQPAPSDAGQVSFESVEAVVRLLTAENRALLATIEQKRPQSVAELANLVGRAEPNVSRTLGKLVATGFVRLKEGSGRTKIPEVVIHRVTVDIDVCQQMDKVAVA